MEAKGAQEKKMIDWELELIGVSMMIGAFTVILIHPKEYGFVYWGIATTINYALFKIGEKRVAC